MQSKILKVFSYLIFTSILFQSSSLAFAQIPALDAVPIDHPGLGQGGTAGSIAAGAAKVALEGAKKAAEGCAKAEATGGKANTAANLAFGGLSLVGGSEAEVLQVEGQLKAIEGYKLCREAVAVTLGLVPTPNLIIAQQKQQISDENELALKNLQKRADDLQVQARIAKRGLWKGIMIKFLLTSSKSILTKMANSLTNKYKIRDFNGYADAVASQVYTNQLIRSQARDGRDQLIIRSILTNPALENKIQSSIYQRASDAIEMDGQVYKVEDVDFNDPKFYQKMQNGLKAETDPYFLNTVLVGQAQVLQAQGKNSAQAEIAQSNGFKSPRNCRGNISQQTQIDGQYKEAERKFSDRLKLYTELKNYQQSMKNFTTEQARAIDADLAKAKADLDLADAELKKLPQTLNSPVLEICDTLDSIVSPARLVDKTVDKALGQLSTSFSDYKQDGTPLPFFINFVSEIGSTFVSNLLFGGNGGSFNTLTERGQLENAINNGLGFANSAAKEEQLSKGIRFDAGESGNANEYTLEWEVFDVKEASYVTISGGIGLGNTLNQRLPLSGKTTVTTQSAGTYTYILKVFNAAGKQLESVSEDLITTVKTTSNGPIPTPTPAPTPLPTPTPASGSACGGNFTNLQACLSATNDQAYCNTLCGNVQGAYISVSKLDIRGQSQTSKLIIR